jgi:hypothetical protein
VYEKFDFNGGGDVSKTRVLRSDEEDEEGHNTFFRQ